MKYSSAAKEARKQYFKWMQQYAKNHPDTCHYGGKDIVFPIFSKGPLSAVDAATECAEQLLTFVTPLIPHDAIEVEGKSGVYPVYVWNRKFVYGTWDTTGSPSPIATIRVGYGGPYARVWIEPTSNHKWWKG